MLKLVGLSTVICALVVAVMMGIFVYGIRICPFSPEELNAQCEREALSIAIGVAANSSWKGALFGAAIGSIGALWRFKKS